MIIVGISAYYHDSAACILVDGVLIAAAQEERFTRIRHDASFPVNALKYCLKQSDISPNEIDYVVFYEKPFLKFERILETYLAFAPKGFESFASSLPVWIKQKLFQKSILIDALIMLWGRSSDWKSKLLFSEHHLSHAASAFFPSPFNNAAVLTIDGVGEWATTTLSIGSKNDLSIINEIRYPHSLGLLYSAFTYYLGFKVNSGEYKVMGLAPYGEPKFANLIRDHLICIKPDGSFALDMSYFNFCTGLTMTNEKFNNLFGGPPRKPSEILTQRAMNIAASIQLVTEEVILGLANWAKRISGQKNLCMAGGVALNCVANGKLMRKSLFEGIWVQPAAGDAGGAVGAAMSAHYLMLKQPRIVDKRSDGMRGSFLGPEYSNNEIVTQLTKCGAVFFEHSDQEVIEITAKAIADGCVVGWMSGRMEFGPRALGGRSILADPRAPGMQKKVNLKVKFRESFRPFAPSILREDLNSWFEFDVDSPYMLFVSDVVKSKRKDVSETDKELFGIENLYISRSEIPAVTHVDYSARVQTVHKETNPRYYSLIEEFKRITGCPILLNTSFNVRGEPIVCSPEDAFRCFMGTNIDMLVCGNTILKKSDQSPELININFRNDFDTD